MLKYKVNITAIFGNENLMEFDDVFMFDFFKDGNFSESSLSIGGMLESLEYFFEGVGFFGGFINDFPDMTVGSRSEFFENFIRV